MTAFADFQQFVTDAQAGTQYAKWAQANPGDLARWQIVRDAILAGGRPPLPDMLTAHGRELIDAARQYLDATAPAPVPAPLLKVVITGPPVVGQTLAAQIVAA